MNMKWVEKHSAEVKKLKIKDKLQRLKLLGYMLIQVTTWRVRKWTFFTVWIVEWPLPLSTVNFACDPRKRKNITKIIFFHGRKKAVMHKPIGIERRGRFHLSPDGKRSQETRTWGWRRKVQAKKIQRQEGANGVRTNSYREKLQHDKSAAAKTSSKACFAREKKMNTKEALWPLWASFGAGAALCGWTISINVGESYILITVIALQNI